MIRTIRKALHLRVDRLKLRPLPLKQRLRLVVNVPNKPIKALTGYCRPPLLIHVSLIVKLRKLVPDIRILCQECLIQLPHTDGIKHSMLPEVVPEVIETVLNSGIHIVYEVGVFAQTHILRIGVIPMQQSSSSHPNQQFPPIGMHQFPSPPPLRRSRRVQAGIHIVHDIKIRSLIRQIIGRVIGCTAIPAKNHRQQSGFLRGFLQCFIKNFKRRGMLIHRISPIPATKFHMIHALTMYIAHNRKAIFFIPAVAENIFACVDLLDAEVFQLFKVDGLQLRLKGQIIGAQLRIQVNTEYRRFRAEKIMVLLCVKYCISIIHQILRQTGNDLLMRIIAYLEETRLVQRLTGKQQLTAGIVSEHPAGGLIAGAKTKTVIIADVHLVRNGEVLHRQLAAIRNVISAGNFFEICIAVIAESQFAVINVQPTLSKGEVQSPDKVVFPTPYIAILHIVVIIVHSAGQLIAHLIHRVHFTESIHRNLQIIRIMPTVCTGNGKDLAIHGFRDRLFTGDGNVCYTDVG